MVVFAPILILKTRTSRLSRVKVKGRMPANCWGSDGFT